MENYTENNKAQICGVVKSEPEFSHEIFGEKFYLFVMRIPRLSGVFDDVKVMVSDRLLPGMEINVGDELFVSGQFRSYNSFEKGANRLILTVFAKDLYPKEDFVENPNSLYLNGFICKEPIFRTTPFGREICDMLIAVNRTYNKSDYIPIIAWGRNARFCKTLSVGDNIMLWGRIQSRVYQKRLSETETEDRTAYEVSVSRMEQL